MWSERNVFQSPPQSICYPLPARLRNDTTMKKLTLTSITFFLLLSLFGQNGLKNGNLFLLLKDKKTISLNSFENNKINELKSFSISNKSIYTTDQKARVAILDTAKNNLTIFDINSSNQIKLTIPFDIKPKIVLLHNNNIFVGGEMGKEILIQYNFQNEKWYRLEIPEEVLFWGKAIDDLVVNDSLLIAIDNIVIPKYILFYHLNSSNRLELSHYKELKSNGCYEEICLGRISNEFLVLKSKTASMGGRTNHITIIKKFDFENCFSLSTNMFDKDFHSFNDFVISGEKLIIASEEKGLGVFEIKETYFDTVDNNSSFNKRIEVSNITYKAYPKQSIIKVTIIPNSDKIILTLEDNKGGLKYEIIEI